MARRLGLGEEYPLPVVSQSYGTVPDSAWKLRKYKQEWTRSDTLNAVIGQGYVLVNPLQLAAMAARIASGRNVQPILVGGRETPAQPPAMPPEHFEKVRHGRRDGVTGAGPAGRTRLPTEGTQRGGQTGTAHVPRTRP